jgi:hypothetical protein
MDNTINDTRNADEEGTRPDNGATKRNGNLDVRDDSIGNDDIDDTDGEESDDSELDAAVG